MQSIVLKIIVHDNLTHSYFTNISGACGEAHKVPIKALNIILLISSLNSIFYVYQGPKFRHCYLITHCYSD
jgi:hypothetical protein